jgi:hypothetical protein
VKDVALFSRERGGATMAPSKASNASPLASSTFSRWYPLRRACAAGVHRDQTPGNALAGASAAAVRRPCYEEEAPAP